MSRSKMWGNERKLVLRWKVDHEVKEMRMWDEVAEVSEGADGQLEQQASYSVEGLHFHVKLGEFLVV